MILRNCFSVVALLGILVFISGCGGAKLPDDLPTLHPAQITVTAGGERLDGAAVTLELIGGRGAEIVAGTTDASGVARLYTRGEYVGAPAGKYKVTVNWSIITETPKTPPTDPERLKRYREAVAEGLISETDVTYTPGLDPVYGSLRTTPLEVEIVDGRNNLSVEVKKLAQ